MKAVSLTLELLEAKDALNNKQELAASNEEIEASYNELAAVGEGLRDKYGMLMEGEERNRAIKSKRRIN